MRLKSQNAVISQTGILSRLKRWLGIGAEGENDKKQERHTQPSIAALERKLHHSVRNPQLFIQALKHRSYLHVSSEARIQSYERLEFLGDAILNMISSEWLYLTYGDHEEGDMTKCKALLVNKRVLAQRAERLGLAEHILLSEGEEKSGGRTRPSILSDVMEALIGAIYLDSNYETVRSFVRNFVLCDVDRILTDETNVNFKGELLEFAQSHDLGSPLYSVIEESGPEHQKRFTIEVLIKNKSCGRGKGLSKKDAEQQAAREALKSIKNSQ